MSRLKACFDQLKAQQRTALIPYIAAGDPNPDITVDLMHELVSAGADVIELGVPFSDPMADGPVIQKASERALVYGTSLADVIEMVAVFRQTNEDTPLVLMGYLNPIEIMRYEIFAKQASAAGVDGVLTVDIPPEEAEEYVPALKGYGLDPIFLLSPTTTRDRMKVICKYASGFIYYVSVKGITGTSALDISAVTDKLNTIRSITDLPVGVGFGIKNAATAAAIGKIADAVIVGSALVNLVEQNAPDNAKIIREINGILSSMRHAIDVIA
jgi:tryptophan synthase alpha chain